MTIAKLLISEKQAFLACLGCSQLHGETLMRGPDFLVQALESGLANCFDASVGAAASAVVMAKTVHAASVSRDPARFVL